LYGVTFIIAGEPRTVECDPTALPYQHHGLRGSLLDVALNFDIPLEHVCGGNCACTTCHVIVRSGMEHLSTMEDNEADRLDQAWDLRPESRLACQAIVKGEVVCEVPAYSRNYVQEDGRIQLGTGKSAGPEPRQAAKSLKPRA
jgi:2Fe-2S ferredoxin